MSEQRLFYELSCYTQTHPDPSFIHQHVVDAFAAQNADEDTKPITLTFALIGLYLHLEKNFSGREMQEAHIKLAKHREKWPVFHPPEHRGNIRVLDVVASPEGPQRDGKINQWCNSVWNSYSKSHEKVARLANAELYNRRNKRKNLYYHRGLV